MPGPAGGRDGQRRRAGRVAEHLDRRQGDRGGEADHPVAARPPRLADAAERAQALATSGLLEREPLLRVWPVVAPGTTLSELDADEQPPQPG